MRGSVTGRYSPWPGGLQLMASMPVFPQALFEQPQNLEQPCETLRLIRMPVAIPSEPGH